jgi:hypothetical protein
VKVSEAFLDILYQPNKMQKHAKHIEEGRSQRKFSGP